jgi:alpha-L-fucosidase
MQRSAFSTILLLFAASCFAAEEKPKRPLARPTPEQAAWHDDEIGMFIHFGPATWQDSEYDTLATLLDKINPSALDTGQWVTVAESMGAKYIVFVAKHTGGFCWWHTNTTDYSVKNTAWRGGKGDVLKDLSQSCQRRGLKLGVYLSPADAKFGAGVGGRCGKPEDQARYEKVYRQQLTELLTQYGQMHEVWFDGSLIFDVGDILRKHAPKAMVFQGPQATIRWVGNEGGYAPYPAWNGLSQAAARSGVATAADGNPDGDAWLPNECDTTMRAGWFWKSTNASTLRSLNQLLDVYYRSVGHGAVLLLNNTPDTSGLIPETDVRRSAEFGAEIQRRFGASLAETKGEGEFVELDLGRPTRIDTAIIMEQIAEGERIREYVLEGFSGGKWARLTGGTAIGHKKIDRFGAAEVTKVRLRVLKAVEKPLVRKLAIYCVRGDVKPPEAASAEPVGAWGFEEIRDGKEFPAERGDILYTEPWVPSPAR